MMGVRNRNYRNFSKNYYTTDLGVGGTCDEKGSGHILENGVDV